jgi:pantoate--beta-alanine ligase
MLTARTPNELRAALARLRRDGRRVGFVPTMGALHAGHLALVARARELAERVVVSIFVNPTQFGPGEDFERYPRSPQRDAELLAPAGCDLLFLPRVEDLYPSGHATFVEVGGPARGLEGDARPGHFRGVATVVTQLFHLIAPEVAVFGEKDAQQLAVVRRLVRDLHLPVAIVGHPTVREPDGLALSSRNVFLAPAERRAALALPRALERAAAAIAGGERAVAALLRLLHAALAEEPSLEVEYAAAVDAESFAPLPAEAALRGRVVLPLAVRVGATRLIDNLQVALDA